MTKTEEINQIIDIAIQINAVYQRMAATEVTEKSLLQLKGLIHQEKSLYESLAPTLEDCALLINTIESGQLGNSNFDEIKEYAIHRILNKLKYMYLEGTYLSNGAYKHLIDKYTQMLYSEFINNTNKYPEHKQQMIFSAFYIISLSPYIELDLLTRELLPYEIYNDDLLMFARFKRTIAKHYPEDFKKNEELYGVDHIYRESTESFIGSYISYTLKVLLEEFKNDNDYYIYPLTELKVQLAMLPKQVRERKYQDIVDIFKKEKISKEKMDILKESFIEVETTIVPKINYFPSVFQNKKASN